MLKPLYTVSWTVQGMVTLILIFICMCFLKILLRINLYGVCLRSAVAVSNALSNIPNVSSAQVPANKDSAQTSAKATTGASNQVKSELPPTRLSRSVHPLHPSTCSQREDVSHRDGMEVEHCVKHETEERKRDTVKAELPVVVPRKYADSGVTGPGGHLLE